MDKSENQYSFSTFISILLLPVFILAGCEGSKCGEGIVADKQTGLPLDSVKCDVITGTYHIYTDSTGNFEICNPMGGCTFGCKDITIEFSKPGYKTVLKTNDACNGTVYLEK